MDLHVYINFKNSRKTAIDLMHKDFTSNKELWFQKTPRRTILKCYLQFSGGHYKPKSLACMKACDVILQEPIVSKFVSKLKEKLTEG